jgi:hypothetical protein
MLGDITVTNGFDESILGIISSDQAYWTSGSNHAKQESTGE